MIAQHLFDYTLIESIYIASTDLNIVNRQEKLADLEKKNEEALSDSIASCILDEGFGALFDETISANSTEEDPIDNYCAAKHVIDNKLVDSSFNIIVNPDNVDYSAANCTAFFLESSKKAEDDIISKYPETDINEATKACIREKFYQKNLADRKITFEIMKKFITTPEQKAIARAFFISYMIDLSGSFFDCK